MRRSFRPYFAPDSGAATATADADASTDTAEEGESSGETEGEQPSTPSFGDESGSPDNPFDIDTLKQRSDLEGEMAKIGGNLGRSQSDESDAETAEQDEVGLEAADTGEGEASEDEQAEAEGEEGPPDEEPSDEEDTSEEAEAEEEEADDTENEADEAQGEELPSNVQEMVNEYVPDRVVETEDQLRDTLEEFSQISKVHGFFDQMVAEDPHLEEYLTLKAQEDMEPTRAAMRAFGDALEAPDPQEDPEAYAEYLAEKKKAESEAEQEEQAEQEDDEMMQRLDRQTAKSLERLANKRDMDQDDVARFQKKVNTLIFGDARGNVPSDQMERLHFALNKDEIIEQAKKEAYEEGKKDGRNESIEEENNTRKGDGLPKPEGSSAPDEPQSEESEELQNLARSFSERQVSPDDFAL